MDVYQLEKKLFQCVRLDFGKTWACHSNPDRPCRGAIKWLQNRNLPSKVIDKNLLTEKTEWYNFVDKSKMHTEERLKLWYFIDPS